MQLDALLRFVNAAHLFDRTLDGFILLILQDLQLVEDGLVLLVVGRGVELGTQLVHPLRRGRLLDLDAVHRRLQLADLEAYALAYAKPTAGIAANLRRMLDGLNLPLEQPRDQLPRDVFLTLVAQYWFDPSPDAPGRWLFHLDPT